MNKDEKKVLSCFINLDNNTSVAIGIDWIKSRTDVNEKNIEKALQKLNEQQWLEKMSSNKEYRLTESGITHYQNQVAHDIGSKSRKIHYFVTAISVGIALSALLLKP